MENRFQPEYEVNVINNYWSSHPKSVLVVEDHQIVREGIKKVLLEIEPFGSIRVVEAQTLAEANDLLTGSVDPADLVILDVNLPDAGGAEAIYCLKSAWAGRPVVIFSSSDDWNLAAEFMRAGALGFIPKNSCIEVITNALRLIFSGGNYFPPQVFGLLTPTGSPDHVSLPETSSQVSVDNKSHHQSTDLSPRQREVLQLMLQGRSNKEIARELNVSVGTAKNYVAVVLRAYNTTSRAKAMLAALNEIKTNS